MTGKAIQAVLEAYLPSNFGCLPIQQIAELRLQLQEKRLQYQAEVQKHCHDLHRVAPEGETKRVEKRIIDRSYYPRPFQPWKISAGYRMLIASSSTSQRELTTRWAIGLGRPFSGGVR